MDFSSREYSTSSAAFYPPAAHIHVPVPLTALLLHYYLLIYYIMSDV